MPKMSKAQAESFAQARGVFEAFQQQLQDVYDNRTETWQDSEKGEAMAAYIDDLQLVLDAIDVVDTETYAEV